MNTPDRIDLARRRQLRAAAASGLALAWPGGSWAREATLEAALRERVARDGVGFAAVQVGPTGMVWHTAGSLRQGSPEPVTRRTLFELGSLTKAFVALLLADAVLDGRASFDDPVEAALPGGQTLRDTNGEPLRLIDLATHRSGLPRMPANLSPKELSNPYPSYGEARLLAFLRDWKAEVPRGNRFEYSNLGYGLLAQVLAWREGTTLDSLLARRVFQPLGLTDLHIRRPLPAGDDLAAVGAALGASLARAPREATGHDGQRKPLPAWQFGVLAGAIGLVGSIEPIGRFIEAAVGLFDHPLKDAFALCLQQRTEGEHPLHPFGLAWELSPIWSRAQPRLLFNQDGATAGFSSSLWIEPARRRGAAVLSNAFIETRGLALQAMDPALTSAAFSLPPLPGELIAPLVGHWQLDTRFALDIMARDGRLWVKPSDQPEFEMLPRNPRHWFVRDATLQLRFDDQPTPGTLLVLRDGKGMLFRRRR